MVLLDRTVSCSSSDFLRRDGISWTLDFCWSCVGSNARFHQWRCIAVCRDSTLNTQREYLFPSSRGGKERQKCYDNLIRWKNGCVTGFRRSIKKVPLTPTHFFPSHNFFNHVQKRSKKVYSVFFCCFRNVFWSAVVTFFFCFRNAFLFRYFYDTIV